MATVDLSHDEMAVALSYVLGITLSAKAPAPAAAKAAVPASPKKAAPAPKAASPKKGKAPPPKADEDEVDDLFGDDEEEAALAVPKAKEPTMKEKMEAAKAAKTKDKKVERSQIVLEVKPWEAEADLVGLFNKIVAVKIDGLVWGEAYKLVPVAFGVKKLVISCVVEDEKVGVEDITDAIEQFEDDVQSVDMATMNRL
ncbi:unnamed protein product [Phaeothamnion confervicola]